MHGSCLSQSLDRVDTGRFLTPLANLWLQPHATKETRRFHQQQKAYSKNTKTPALAGFLDVAECMASGQGRDRTGDTCIFSAVLYQLST